MTTPVGAGRLPAGKAEPGATTRLSRPELRPLVEELARRLGDGALPSGISLRRLPPETFGTLADLLGLDRLQHNRSQLAVPRLLTALGLADVEQLRRAVEAVVGPLPHPRTDRRAERDKREELWAWLSQEAASLPLGGGTDRMAAWAAAQRARGARGGVETHRKRLQHALAVLRRLPADGVMLSVLAAEAAGGPHALDHGRTVAGIVLDAAARALDQPAPSNAEETRRLWESAGVSPDPLSSTVTCLGLPGDDASPLGAWLTAAAINAEPVVLSLANLRRWPRPPLPEDMAVYVVENPALLAEAAQLCWPGPPLVCSSGRPTVAVVTLLRQLGQAGARLYQHADFDPTGVAITAWLEQRAGTTPWRMGSEDYLGAVRSQREDRVAICGVIPETPWDPCLHDAMNEEAVAVYEEELRADLLGSVRRVLS